MICVSAYSLIALIKSAYRHSKPMGMGHMHFTPGDLTLHEAAKFLNPDFNHRIVAKMDYVKGRCCKFTIFQEGDDFFINDPWPDHTDEELQAMLADAKTIAKELSHTLQAAQRKE